MQPERRGDAGDQPTLGAASLLHRAGIAKAPRVSISSFAPTVDSGQAAAPRTVLPSHLWLGPEPRYVHEGGEEEKDEKHQADPHMQPQLELQPQPWQLQQPQQPQQQLQLQQQQDQEQDQEQGVRTIPPHHPQHLLNPAGELYRLLRPQEKLRAESAPPLEVSAYVDACPKTTTDDSQQQQQQQRTKPWEDGQEWSRAQRDHECSWQKQEPWQWERTWERQWENHYKPQGDQEQQREHESCQEQRWWTLEQNKQDTWQHQEPQPLGPTSGNSWQGPSQQWHERSWDSGWGRTWPDHCWQSGGASSSNSKDALVEEREAVAGAVGVRFLRRGAGVGGESKEVVVEKDDRTEETIVDPHTYSREILLELRAMLLQVRRRRRAQKGRGRVFALPWTGLGVLPGSRDDIGVFSDNENEDVSADEEESGGALSSVASFVAEPRFAGCRFLNVAIVPSSEQSPFASNADVASAAKEGEAGSTPTVEIPVAQHMLADCRILKLRFRAIAEESPFPSDVEDTSVAKQGRGADAAPAEARLVAEPPLVGCRILQGVTRPALGQLPVFPSTSDTSAVAADQDGSVPSTVDPPTEKLVLAGGRLLRDKWLASSEEVPMPCVLSVDPSLAAEGSLARPEGIALPLFVGLNVEVGGSSGLPLPLLHVVSSFATRLKEAFGHTLVVPEFLSVGESRGGGGLESRTRGLPREQADGHGAECASSSSECGGFCWPRPLHMTTFYLAGLSRWGLVPPELPVGAMLALELEGSLWRVRATHLVYAYRAALVAVVKVEDFSLPLEPDAIPHVTLLVRPPFPPSRARAVLAAATTAGLLLDAPEGADLAGAGADAERAPSPPRLVAAMRVPFSAGGAEVLDLYVLSLEGREVSLEGRLQSFWETWQI